MTNEEFDDLMKKLLQHGMKKDKQQIERLKKKLQNNFINNTIRQKEIHERSTAVI